jgi:hypothetical protein
MDDPCSLYKSQYRIAKKTLDGLHKDLEELNLKLESSPINAGLHKELRTMNMDIKITMNEIEHAEFSLKKCELKYNINQG